MTEQRTSSGSALSEEQRLQIGQWAAEARNNPIEKIIVDHLYATYTQQSDNTEPQHKNEREWLHAKKVVLREYVGTRDSLIGIAEKILSERMEQNSQGYKDQQDADTQGFGLNFNQGAAR